MGKDQDLLQAVKEQDLHALQKILSKAKGAKKLIGSSKKLNINHQDHDGMAGLHQAALVGNVGIMKLLLDYGASTDLKDVKGMRPLHYASWQGKVEPVAILLQHGSSANEPAFNGDTPVHLACQHGHYEIVNRLIHYRGDPTLKNKENKTPFDLACECGRFQVVELLVHSTLVSSLLHNTANDLADSNTTTCLHLSARNGHSDIIRLLLQAGVNINRQTHQGTCLHEAALCGKTEVVKLLVDCGIDINRHNSYDQTALDIVNKFTTSRAAKELKNLLKDAGHAIIAKAIKDYHNPYDAKTLSFKQGDIISVLDPRTDGVWRGFVMQEGQQISQPGYFPANTVMLVDKHAVVGKSSSGVKASPRKVVPPQIPDLLTNRILSNGGVHNAQHNNNQQQYQYNNGQNQHLQQHNGYLHHNYQNNVSHSPQHSPLPGLHNNQTNNFASIGVDDSFPPPPSPLVTPKSPSRDSDRDSGISPQQGYPPHGFPGQDFSSPTSPGQYDWFGRHVTDDARSSSPSQSSPGSSNRNSGASSGSGGFMPNGGYGNGTVNAQHRLSGQSYESGVSTSSRQSYHSNSSSGSVGSLDRLEESGYSSTVNVHELYQQGLTDSEVLRTWLTELHFEEYYHLFVQAGYDMPTISRMTPEDLTAIGITKPAHRKRLKSEISRLHIHDGIPDFRPNDVLEWLRLLGLDQYWECMAMQGYTSMESLSDIMWEDLEEIGIKKLGHQKKIMLALDKLKRLSTGSKRNSTLERKTPSRDVLEPPSAYPTPKWLAENGSPGSPPSPYLEHVTITTPRPTRSSSGDNILDVSMASDMSTFHHPHGSPGGIYTPDLVAIQLNRGTPPRQPFPALDSVGQQSPVVQSYHSRRLSDCQGSQSEGDLLSVQDRSFDEADHSATLRRSKGMVSPRIAPKPIAKIMAENKRASKDMCPEVLKVNSVSDERFNQPGYSGTLGRKSSFHHQNRAEHIYDLPSSLTSSPQHSPTHRLQVQIPKSGSSTPEVQNSPNRGSYTASPLSKGKKPPPPPKRTNSIKLSSFTAQQGDSSPALAPKTTKDNEQFTSSVRNITDRFNQNNSDQLINQKSNGHMFPASSSQCEDFPPPPPPIVSPTASSLDSGYADASLGKAIHELDIGTSSSSSSPSSSLSPSSSSSSNSSKGLPVNVAQPQQLHKNNLPNQRESSPPEAVDSSGDDDSDTDSGFGGRRNNCVSTTSIDSTASISSQDSNTLPFANENVGTIKSRNNNSNSKPSIISVSSEDGAVGGEGERNVDLNASMFEDGSGTIKRKPKPAAKPNNIPTRLQMTAPSTSPAASAASHTKLPSSPLRRRDCESPKKAPPPTPKRRDSLGTNNDTDIVDTPPATITSAGGKESEDVLNDIGSMLQDLTDELDAMLEFDL